MRERIVTRVVTNCLMRLFLSTLNMIDILFSVYSYYFSAKKKYKISIVRSYPIKNRQMPIKICWRHNHGNDLNYWKIIAWPSLPTNFASKVPSLRAKAIPVKRHVFVQVLERKTCSVTTYKQPQRLQLVMQLRKKKHLCF